MCMQRDPTQSSSSSTDSSRRLAVTFILIISAVSHPVLDIHTLLVNAPILSMCHMLSCLLERRYYKELTAVTSLKVGVISKLPVPTSILENKM